MGLITEVQTPVRRSPPKRGPRCGMNRPSMLTQALDAQEILMRDIKDTKTTAQVRAQSTRAWKELAQLIRIIRGLPANTSQSIREPREKKQSKSSTAPLESLPES